MQDSEEYPDFFEEHSPFGFTLDDSKDDLELIEEDELIACTE
jgi:hypothetical protein